MATLKKDGILVFKSNYRLMQVKSIAECSKGSILQYFRPSLKESATNEKTWTVFVQDVSHNINLMRIGKWRRLNMISRCLNIPTQRFLFAWERRHSSWFGSRFCKRLTWSAGARIPDVTSFTLILCVLRMCETHCLCESDYIGVYTLLLFCEYHWFIYWIKIDWNERPKNWSLNH